MSVVKKPVWFEHIVAYFALFQHLQSNVGGHKYTEYLKHKHANSNNTSQFFYTFFLQFLAVRLCALQRC